MAQVDELLPPSGVTKIACIAFVYIPWLPLMIVVGLVFGMTDGTREYGIISGIGVTVCTGIPCLSMRTTVDGEILAIVVKS